MKFTAFPLKTHAISWLTFAQAAFHLQSVSSSQQQTLEKLEKATIDAPKHQKTKPIPAERPVPGCVHLPSGARRTEACLKSLQGFGPLCYQLALKNPPPSSGCRESSPHAAARQRDSFREAICLPWPRSQVLAVPRGLQQTALPTRRALGFHPCLACFQR